MGQNCNASNLLSLCRIILVAPLVYALGLDTHAGNVLAISVGALAGFTDYLDGHLARSRDDVTTAGKYLDPLADKIFVGAALFYLTFVRGNAPLFFGVMIIIRDVLIVLASGILLRRDIVVQPELPGKITANMMLIVMICYIFDLQKVGWWAVLMTTALMLYTTGSYVFKISRLLKSRSG